MTKKFSILILSFLLAACAGGGAPARPSSPGVVTSAPGAVPTQQLTPPGVSKGCCPMLDTPLGGQIVYSNGDGDIYVVDVRPNARPKKIIGAPNDKGFVQEPNWSPDGQRIAYTYLLPFDSSGIPSADLMVANADGSNTQPLFAHQVSGELLAMPTYSVDARYLYYTHTKPIYKNNQIISAAVALERLELRTKQVSAVAADGYQAAVSPDGKRIAYIKVDLDTFQQNLLTADLDGRNAEMVVPGSATGGGLNSPRWSRDGKRILFGAPNFFAMNNQPTNQSANKQTNWLVSWLVGWFDVPVAEAHGPPWDFWIVDADGKNMQRLTEIGEDEPQATFSPDGNNIAFMGLAGIYILDANGKNVRWLHREGGRGRVDWKK